MQRSEVRVEDGRQMTDDGRRRTEGGMRDVATKVHYCVDGDES